VYTKKERGVYNISPGGPTSAAAAAYDYNTCPAGHMTAAGNTMGRA